MANPNLLGAAQGGSNTLSQIDALRNGHSNVTTTLSSYLIVASNQCIEIRSLSACNKSSGNIEFGMAVQWSGTSGTRHLHKNIIIQPGETFWAIDTTRNLWLTEGTILYLQSNTSNALDVMYSGFIYEV